MQRNEIGKDSRRSKWVPHQLSDVIKDQRQTICSSPFTRLINDPFLSRIVTEMRSGFFISILITPDSGFL